MSAPEAHSRGLGDLTAAAQRTVAIFGNRTGVVTVGVTYCAGGGPPHVDVGTDSLATLGRLVSDLAQVSPVQHIADASIPAWIGEANGVQLCVYVAMDEEAF